MGFGTFSVRIALCSSLLVLLVMASIPRRALAQSGLRLAKSGTERAYFTRNGLPLLSFGGQADSTDDIAVHVYRESSGGKRSMTGEQV